MGAKRPLRLVILNFYILLFSGAEKWKSWRGWEEGEEVSGSFIGCGSEPLGGKKNWWDWEPEVINEIIFLSKTY